MVKAVIFDLDGVICSTDEYHYLAWKKLADDLGVYFDREINNRLRGVSRMASLDIILERSVKTFSPEEKKALADQKNDMYRNLLACMGPSDLATETIDTLNTLRTRGIKLAIGSSSKNALFILDRIGLSDFFDAVSDGNNISQSKPDPEVFLKAAEYLGFDPKVCLVVEDALAGAEAGHRGGFTVACVGDAALAHAGDYNLTSLSQLLDVIRQHN